MQLAANEGTVSLTLHGSFQPFRANARLAAGRPIPATPKEDDGAKSVKEKNDYLQTKDGRCSCFNEALKSSSHQSFNSSADILMTPVNLQLFR